MAWDVSLDFEEAVGWFLSRLPISKSEFERLDATAKKRAFTVANLTTVRMIADVQNSLTSAIKNGSTLKEWQAEQVSTGLSDSHLETIFRTNVQSSYAAGREKLASHPTVKRLRPYRRYDAVLDDRTTDECKSLDGTVLPADDPFWDSNSPPRHFNCRAGLVTLTARQAEREGVTETPPSVEAQEGFGARPKVNDEVEPEQGDVPDGLWAEFEKKTQ